MLDQRNRSIITGRCSGWLLLALCLVLAKVALGQQLPVNEPAPSVLKIIDVHTHTRFEGGPNTIKPTDVSQHLLTMKIYKLRI